MAHWAIERGLHLRFIEYMPFACNGWSREQVIPASELRERLFQAFELQNGIREQQDSPAVDYPVTGTDASIGIIACVTEPFCRHCSRMRLTPDGRLRPCLHDDKEYDIVGPLRAGADTDTLHTIFRSAAWSKSSGRAPFPTTNGSINKVTFRPMIHMGG
jgi:cyclic pyranopterin phosphate synthase